MYSSLGRAVFAAKDSNEAGQAIADLTIKLKEREVPEREFDAGFEQIIFTNKHTSQKQLVQYILKKIAKHESQPFIGGTDDLTIEHLLPQSKISDGIDSHLVGQLGNLMLVDAETNSMLATEDFGKKKEILKERGYKIPEIFEEVETLEENAIGLNTMRLAKLSREEIWKV